MGPRAHGFPGPQHRPRGCCLRPLANAPPCPLPSSCLPDAANGGRRGHPGPRRVGRSVSSPLARPFARPQPRAQRLSPHRRPPPARRQSRSPTVLFLCEHLCIPKAAFAARALAPRAAPTAQAEACTRRRPLDQARDDQAAVRFGRPRSMLPFWTARLLRARPRAAARGLASAAVLIARQPRPASAPPAAA